MKKGEQVKMLSLFKSGRKRYHRYHKSGILRSLKSAIEDTTLGELLVKSGYVSPSQLRALLKQQKSDSRRVGQLAVQSGYITQRGLVYLLFQQRTIRFVAAFIALMISVMCMTTSKARAGSIKDIPAKLQVVYTPDYSKYSYLKRHPHIFGMHEVKSRELKEFTKWSGMFSRFERQLERRSGNAAMISFQNDIKQFSDLPPMDKIIAVNNLINKVEYKEDIRNWGLSDYWATPFEFMQNGGDCEDYAIAKYVALRALGVPENRLRLAIVKDLVKGIPHAVLIVYTDEGPVVLDNQSKDVKFSEDIYRYKPFFSINRHAWWLHTQPDDKTVVAAVN